MAELSGRHPSCVMKQVRVHPHITYGILAWGNAKASLFRKTQIIQKKISWNHP